MVQPGRLDPERDALLRALTNARVDFVLVGGAALESHAQPHQTEDLDVLPKRTQENLQRLAGVLNTLDCRLIVDPEDPAQDVPLPAGYFTAASIAQQDFLNLRTAHGRLDVMTRPAGFPGGYDELRPRAQALTVASTTIAVPVASLEDVEHSKRVAARPKDRAYLQSVGRLQDPAGAQLAALKRSRTANYPTSPADAIKQPGPADPATPPHRTPGPSSPDLER